MTRDVTEQDFRMPEFRHAKVEDYEFRKDGKLVRKDRWEAGIYSIAGVLGLGTRSGFEIDELVEKARQAAQAAGLSEDWTSEDEDLPTSEALCDVRMQDGSVLKGASWLASPNGTGRWQWGDHYFERASEPPVAKEAVVAWRVRGEDEQ